MKPFAFVLAALLILIPTSTSAASPKPSIRLIEPQKNAQFSTTDQMEITWETKNITRDMVVATDIKLIKKDPSQPSTGFVSGGGYVHTVRAGDTTGGFTDDWSINEVIPGTYSITAQLYECAPQGCSYSPQGRKVGKKSKAVRVVVKSSADLGAGTSNGTSYIRIASPNGGEKFKAGSGKNLTVKWEATNVPKRSSVCVTLERQGGNGGFFAFPADGESCVPAKEGKDSITGSLIQNSGYNLSPGNYWARISLNGYSDDGKDGRTLATDLSDKVFVLR